METRIIKFRAWVSGNYMRYNVGFHPYMSVNLVSAGAASSEDFTKQDESVIWSPGMCALMQYSGKKDRRDTEIFEGDIMSLEGTQYRYEVRFEDAKFVCYHQFGKWGDLQRFFDVDFEKYAIYVIGNKYEHPHLLNL